MSNQFGEKIKQLREANSLLQRHVASQLNIDAPMLCKIERGERRAKREQVSLLITLLNTTEEELVPIWLADQIYNLIEDEKFWLKSLKIVRDSLTNKL